MTSVTLYLTTPLISIQNQGVWIEITKDAKIGKVELIGLSQKIQLCKKLTQFQVNF